MRIAIFSGSIPTATFIEHVIKGVSTTHKVYLFGVVDKPYHYKNKRIKVYATPKSHFKNLIITLYRVFLLIFLSPASLYALVKEVQQYTRLYDRWIWFTKFLPIVLYKPDILHLQWARDIPFYYFIKDTINCKLVISLLGSHINYSPIADTRLAQQYNELFPKVDAFHAVSEAITKETVKYGADLQKIKIIRSPIQYEAFSLYRDPKKTKKIKIVSVGRHHWVKGYAYAIKAMEILKKTGVVFTYDIIAQGTVPEELIFIKNQLNLQNEVRFLDGISPQSRLFEKMQSYDVLILSSLSEGIANVVLEAMALGVPVISTNCGGMAEVIKPNETGWLVPVRDPKALADAITELHHTLEHELQRITANAHQLVKQHFNAEDRIAEFLEFYGDVVLSSEF